MSKADITITIFILAGAYQGVKDGFILELISIAAILIGLLAGFKLMSWIMMDLEEKFHIDAKVLPYIAFATVFFIIVFSVNLLTKYISPKVNHEYLDLKSWSTANLEENGLRNVKVITTDHRLVAPGEYIVLTTSKQVLTGEYLQAHADNIIEVKALPAMNDDAGSIAILNEQGKILDHFTYTKQFHSVFIKDEEGVSLERISFTAETNDPQNWKSASSHANFATPGYINSQSRPDVLHDDAVVITPEIFAPLNGNPDFTEIQYHFDQSGFVANVKILDSNGREIKRLANNELLGTSGFIRWDGDQNDGTKARVGYYMVWFEVIDPAGSVKTIRKRLAIASRF